MKYNNIGNCKTIDKYVAKKIKKFDEMEKTFQSLFSLMFSEKNNVLFEKTTGYKIQKYTYGECEKNIKLKARTLKDKLSEFDSQSTVGIYMNNSFEWIEIFWACIMAGFNPLLLNMRVDEDSLNSSLARSRACAVISDDKTFSIKTIKASDITPSDTEIEMSDWGEEVFVMSSGTTFNVKICAYTAKEFYYQIKGSYGIIKESKQMKKHYNGDLKLLTFLPFYHIFGLVAVYVWFTFFSRTLALLNDLNPQTITNTIKKHKVTHVFAVPLFWEKVYQTAIRTIKDRGEKTYKKFLKGMKLSRLPIIGKIVTKIGFKEVRDNMFGESICFMITGGSGIPNYIIEFFNAVGYHLANGYGMTEIGITSVELTNKKRVLNSGSIGHAMQNVEYKISDSGELLVRGKAMASYVLDENGKNVIQNEWFNTRDLAREEKGRYYILGRKDDLVVSPSGENLNPNIIESKLTVQGTLGVTLTTCHAKGKTLPLLIVFVNKYIKPDKLREINALVLEKISELKLSGEIEKIVFTSDSMLKGEEFKLNRQRIKRDYESGEMTVLDISAEEKEEDINLVLAEKVREFFATALNKNTDEISYYSNFFFDEGGTSLDYFALLCELQREFDIGFPSNGEKSLCTIKEFVNYIEENAEK